MRGDPADDLDETGTARVDDSRLAQDVELVPRLLDGLVTPADDV